MIRNRIRELRVVPARELLANPKNWRRHPEAQRRALAGVLREVGYADALIARETPQGLVLIDGHLRAETTPDERVPVLVLDVDEREADLLLATLDPLAGLAEADDPAFRELTADLHVDDAEVRALLDELRADMGEDEPPPSVGRTDPDAVPDVPDAAVTRLGDLWNLDQHRLFCGDSVADAGGRLLVLEGRRSVDVVFTDPPYGVNYVSRVDCNRRKPWGGIANDDLAGEALRSFLAAAIPPARAVYVCADWHCYVDFEAALGKPKAVCVWVKPYFGLGKGYRRQHELVLFYGTFNRTDLSDVWKFERAADYKHPTQKPIALVAKALADSDAQFVYDPFSGSGSTIIAAEQLGRPCAAIELDPRYVDVAIRRWEECTGRSAVLQATGRTFAEVSLERGVP